jgi:hypothetical protein
MIRTLAFLILIFSAVSVEAQYIPPQARVANDKRHGVCFWSCAETIGRTFGISALYGLRDKVLQGNGVGKDGANASSVAYWLDKTGVVRHRETRKDAEFLGTLLKKPLPVIVSMQQWQVRNGRYETHAIIATKILPKQEFTDHRDVKRNDYAVVVFDPNKPDRDSLIAWDWFWQHWTGTMTWIDPSEQDQSLFVKTDAGRLMLADVNGQPATAYSGYDYYKPVIETTHIQPILGYLMPEHIPAPINVVTNDLHDGIHRPYDTIINSEYARGTTHDYRRLPNVHVGPTY